MATNNSPLKIKELGDFGEELIHEMLTGKGKKVKLSEDKFDQEKDMSVGKKKIEVKTQAPYINKNAFTVRTNQMKKLLGADAVYFISVPIPGREDKYAGCIFEMSPKDVEYAFDRTRDGREMVIIKREQKGMKIVHVIKEQKTLDRLVELSSSNFAGTKK